MRKPRADRSVEIQLPSSGNLKNIPPRPINGAEFAHYAYCFVYYVRVWLELLPNSVVVPDFAIHGLVYPILEQLISCIWIYGSWEYDLIYILFIRKSRRKQRVTS
ncbi:hypothetical protein Fmac_008396 [Flemingia macrophylla]|uniref:Uncharacterized protein n=1 Tax=Flemingia macrophylla TaxID=520843 RepID=A0ABD1MXT8_9FABA